MTRAPSDGGLLLVDKHEGPTSHDVVGLARRALRLRRVGHAGTLDPFATGLLLLLVGRATRLVEYFHLLDKRYRASLMLGVETTSHDHTGEVSARSDAWRDVSESRLQEMLRSARGRVRQRPPAFSAKQVAGQRAHRVARTGEEVELEAVPVTIGRLELTAFDPPRVDIETEVSTGTYIRALARDLGRALGCGAHLSALRRTAIGPFSVEDAWPGERLDSIDLDWPHWRSPAEALEWLPRRELDATEVDRVREGRRVPALDVRWAGEWPSGHEDEDGLPVALRSGDRLVAIAERRGPELQPRKVLAAD